jgi:alpha-ketoglutarate-dependent sulfate ester dioxygenase
MKSSAVTTSYRTSEDALDVRSITPAIGAEIHDVRLSGELPSKTMAAIRDALLRHRVVFFRGQGHLDDAEHQAFARLLGFHEMLIGAASVSALDGCGQFGVT